MYAFKACLALLGAVSGHAFVNPTALLPRTTTSGPSFVRGASSTSSPPTRPQRRMTKRSRGVMMATSAPRQPGGDFSARGPDEHSERAVKNMLSESSAASVVYYWLEFRDDLTPQWLKQFTRHVGDIQDIGWAQHLGMLMRAEPEEMTVRRLAQRPRGGSGNNPFLKPTRSAMEYTVLIEPQNIAKKIMQVREQISREWIDDLALVAAENDELARHREDSMFLDVETAEKDRKMVFDHDPLNNTSSPYRGKNYKLLLEMITNAAVRAYRSELRISGDRYTLNWLEKFIHRNEMEGGPNLKGNVLVEAILDGPIVVIKDPRTGKNRVIDPGHIGEQLMGFRQLEAQLVIKAMNSVTDDHARITRQFLEERLRDQMEDVVLTQRRKRIVEASAPDEFPAADSSAGPEGFGV